MEDINRILRRYLDQEGIQEDIVIHLTEKVGFSKLPKGWTEESVEKFAKSLAGKAATEEGFFKACVDKISPHMDDPEGFCASVKDQVWGTTYWRGKDKKKADVEKAKKEGKGTE